MKIKWALQTDLRLNFIEIAAIKKSLTLPDNVFALIFSVHLS